jgi:hypothetical protein
MKRFRATSCLVVALIRMLIRRIYRYKNHKTEIVLKI